MEIADGLLRCNHKTSMKLRHKLTGMGKTFACLVLAVIASADAGAGRIVFESGAKRVSLLELYTSEGCRSCPPADGWLAGLMDSPGLWNDFVPLAFHVDYWNSLGWKDRWSSPEFSSRQNTYAQFWHSPNVYTPCFVLNGKEWRGWSSRRKVLPTAGEHVGVLVAISTDTNHWNVSFVPIPTANSEYEAHAALLACGLSSDVKAGENTGRHLQHEFVVLSLTQTGMTISNGLARGSFILAPPPHDLENILALTVWVTPAGQLEPIQAAGGWLDPAVKPVKH